MDYNKRDLTIRECEADNEIVTKDKGLLIILLISLIGVAFTGYLTYLEMYSYECGLDCGDSSELVLGLPQYAYGLLMYISVAFLSLVGYISEE